MQSLSSRTLSDSDVVKLYEWAERSPSAVLKCTCRHVRHIKTIPSLSHALGGHNLFLHHETPGLVAEVCGMIVGVTPKEDQVTYEVDDGTSVLRVLETRKSLRQSESRPLQTRPNVSNPCGVPECYIMPPQPKGSTSSGRQDSGASYSFLPPLHPRFEVADLVRCAGKIQIDRGGDRFLLVQQMILCEDVNMECHHQIDVIKLENELYRHPFDWKRLDSVKAAAKQESGLQPSSLRLSARRLLSDSSQDEKAMSAPMVNPDVGKQEVTDRQRLSRDEARRLLSSDVPAPWSSAQSTSMPHGNSPQGSERSRSSQANARQLRTHDKISDHKLTESYFQLQLQQHISHCYPLQSFAISDLWSDTALFSLARRLVRVRLQHRLASRYADSSRRIPKDKDTSEQHAEKARRLFEWAIRKMMQDGFVTLAEADQSESEFPKSSETDVASSADRYCLVTPEYLLKPLHKLLGSSKAVVSPQNAASNDVDDLIARLRIFDDRFRYINRSLVQDSLSLYYARCTPIVID
ncbi:uncharacterized protein UTRI_01740_B [Ustilago trichophora]|uniref:CST complex subunit STN1 n=1 Tax=Ustilago trichophora TaxID=86804 RepID=A0A5C3E5D8_9BASI|nr:uncharacterized protein UTRI_01740_B [Ustilago trichophora]